MSTDLTTMGNTAFEPAKKVTPEGIPYWSAREMQQLLGYSDWKSFRRVLLRARLACDLSGNDSATHFQPNNLTQSGVEPGKKEDYALSRFASYLLAQNGDANRPQIANAQAYFAARACNDATSVGNDKKSSSAALNDTVRHVHTLTLALLPIGLYLIAATGSTTDADMLIGKTMKIPFAGIELPLVGFYLAAPAILLAVHANLLLQVVTLSHRLSSFCRPELSILDRVADELFPDPLALSILGRGKADIFALLRFLIFTGSIVVLPIFTLGLFAVTFLPYQSIVITSYHHAVLVTDVVLLIYCFKVVYQNTPSDTHALKSWPKFITAGLMLLSTIPLWFLICVTYENLDRLQPISHPIILGVLLVSLICLLLLSLAKRPFSHRIAVLTLLPYLLIWLYISYIPLLLKQDHFSLLQKRLPIFHWNIVIPRTFTHPYNTVEAQAPQGLQLKNRDFYNAVFFDAHLPQAHFSDSRMQGAFMIANLNNAKFSKAWLEGARMNGSQLRHADFTGSHLQGAVMEEAQLLGSRFTMAELQGTNLTGADLRGADFGNAKLHGTVLQGADLRGANFYGAELYGADLGNCLLQGADFTGARINGISLEDATLDCLTLKGVIALTPDAKTWAEAEVMISERVPNTELRAEAIDRIRNAKKRCKEAINPFSNADIRVVLKDETESFDFDWINDEISNCLLSLAHEEPSTVDAIWRNRFAGKTTWGPDLIHIDSSPEDDTLRQKIASEILKQSEEFLAAIPSGTLQQIKRSARKHDKY